MNDERFVVRELAGWRITPDASGTRSDPPTTDCTVWDTWFTPWREVLTFYSYGRPGPMGTVLLGTKSARAKARDLCDRLNANAAGQDWAQWMPEPVTTCKKGHLLDAENLRVSPSGIQTCLACLRLDYDRNNTRRRAARLRRKEAA